MVSAALYALTLGCVGGFTIGMKAQVARGRTGLPIDAGWLLASAFVAVNLTVLGWGVRYCLVRQL